MPDQARQIDHGDNPWGKPIELADLQAHDIWRFRRDFFRRLFPDVRGLKVVEVGSGPAHDSLFFAQGGAEVMAVDCSPEGLALGRLFYSESESAAGNPRRRCPPSAAGRWPI